MYHLKRKNPIDFGRGRIQDGRLGRPCRKKCFFVINGKPLSCFQLFLVTTFLTPGELFRDNDQNRDDDQMVSCFQFSSLIIWNMYDLFHSMAGDSPSLMVYLINVVMVGVTCKPHNLRMAGWFWRFRAKFLVKKESALNDLTSVVSCTASLSLSPPSFMRATFPKLRAA